jgi:hypothetical protein
MAPPSQELEPPANPERFSGYWPFGTAWQSSEEGLNGQSRNSLAATSKSSEWG